MIKIGKLVVETAHRDLDASGEVDRVARLITSYTPTLQVTNDGDQA